MQMWVGLSFRVLLWAVCLMLWSPYEDPLLGVGVLVEVVMVSLQSGFHMWAEFGLVSGILMYTADGLGFRCTSGYLEIGRLRTGHVCSGFRVTIWVESALGFRFLL